MASQYELESRWEVALALRQLADFAASASNTPAGETGPPFLKHAGSQRSVKKKLEPSLVKISLYSEISP